MKSQESLKGHQYSMEIFEGTPIQHGNLWRDMEIFEGTSIQHGNLWRYINAAWKSLKVHQYSMEIFEGTSMQHGNLWRYINAAWKSLKVHQYSMEIFEGTSMQHGNLWRDTNTAWKSLKGHQYSMEIFEGTSIQHGNLWRDINAAWKSLKGHQCSMEIFEGTSMQHGNLWRDINTAWKSLKVHQYSMGMIQDAMELMLRSRSCYKAPQNTWVFPDIRTVKSFFGKLGSPDSEVISNVFEPLTDLQKYCFIIADKIYIKSALRFQKDKIHIKPAQRFQKGKFIGFPADTESPTVLKTALTIMVTPSLGAPAFVARLPVLIKQVIMDIVHKSGGYVFLIMTDNLSVN